jgi:hypothetical protein
MALNPFEQALQDEGLVGTPLEPIARSIYAQESSGGKNTKTSNAGAVGGMQILPGTFNEVLPGGDINNPYDNSRAGLRYIKKMNDLAGGDPSLTAVGYYGGPGGIQKAKEGVAVRDPRNPNAPTTLEYAKQVTGRQGKVSRETSIRPEDMMEELGQGYQAAYALMRMADEEPKTQRELDAEEERDSQSAAQQFAALQEQLSGTKVTSPFAKKKKVQQLAKGGEAVADDANAQGSSGGFERWLAEKIGIDQAWDTSMAVPKEYGYSGDSGTAGDALRHMTLMREISKKYGDTPAKMIGYAHEYIGGPMQYFSNGEPQSSRDREMDLHNNSLGLELSRQAKDDQDFIRLAQDAIKNKQADYYRNEYSSTMPTNTGNMSNARKMLKEMPKGQIRKRAEGSPEEGEVSLKDTAAQMWANIKKPENWSELGAGMKRAAVATPGVLESLGRGAVATVPGTVGDVESLGRMLVGNQGKNFAPTTEDILKATDKMRMFDKPEGAKDIEEVGGWISPAGAPASGMVTSGAKKVGKAMLQDLDLAMSGQGGSKVSQMLTSQVQPAYAVRPKGGVYLGAQSAKDVPLSRPDFDIRDALEGLDVSTEQGKAVAEFLDKKVRKYVQTQQGTADDPIFKGMLQGRIEPRYLGEPEMWARARAGDPEALMQARRRYDSNLGMTNLVPESVAKEKGKGYSHAFIREQDKKLKAKIQEQSPGEDVLMADVRPIGKKQVEDFPNLYGYHGVKQAVEESESGKLLRMLNPSDLPPHLRQAVREGEPMAYQFAGVGSFGSPLEMRNLKDYLNTRTPAEIKNMGVADVVSKSEEWHRTMAEARKDPSKFSRKQLMQGTEPVLPASKDMNWVDVKGSDALSLEGNIMGHCVGGSNYCNAVNKGTTKIISLRDKKGFPHVTIELAANDKGVFDRVAQVKGTANNSPEKYFQQVDEFLTDYSAKLGEPLRITERPSYVPEKWRK